MRRILVTAISGDIGNGICKILKEQDCVLFGCDVNEIAVGMDLVTKFYRCSFAVADEYTEEILTFCKENEIGYVIPVNEREIERLNKDRKLFEQAGIKLIIQSEKVLSVCLDKYLTAEFLQNLGIGVPATYIGTDGLQDADTYIVKPRCSNGSKNISIRSGAAIKAEGLSSDCVAQEYIDSQEEYTVGIYRNGSVTNVIAFRRELKNGYSNQVVLQKEELFYDLAMKIADGFDLCGYINVQLRVSSGRPYVFEINPRISGTVRFRHLLDYTDVLWWLDLSDGIKTGKYHCPYTEAVGVRELNEKYLIKR